MRVPRLRRSLVLPGVVIAFTALLVGAGAAAAFESDTVDSYWEGLWWALGLMTTVGFVEGSPPASLGGAITSAVLMLAGFLLLSLISAGLASIFVREDEEPAEAREEALDASGGGAAGRPRGADRRPRRPAAPDARPGRSARGGGSRRPGATPDRAVRHPSRRAGPLVYGGWRHDAQPPPSLPQRGLSHSRTPSLRRFACDRHPTPEARTP